VANGTLIQEITVTAFHGPVDSQMEVEAVAVAELAWSL
jgi:hypothetical protein